MLQTEKTRYHLLDFIRGILILGVIVFHFIVDLDTFGFDISSFDIYSNPIMLFLGDFGRVIFILLAGICCKLSKNNLKRSLICLIAALLISIFTYFIVPEFFIYMGILHFLGFCMLIYSLIAFIPRKKQITDSAIIACSVIFLLLFIITFRIYKPSIGISLLFTNIPIKTKLYGSFFGYLLGFGGWQGMSSSDYFPLLPWTFLFIAGSFLGNLFKEEKVPKFFSLKLSSPICFIGRHTLLIYIFHQPIVFGIVYLLSVIK